MSSFGGQKQRWARSAVTDVETHGRHVVKTTAFVFTAMLIRHVSAKGGQKLGIGLVCAVHLVSLEELFT